MSGMIGYILGSEDGRNLNEGDLRECQHQNKLLAQALGTLLVSAKLVADRPMTGPELIAHAGTLALALDDGELQLLPNHAFEALKEAIEDDFDRIKNEGLEMRCQRCPNRNVKSWSVASELWNLVRPDGSGILCPQCFTELHAEATGDWQTWELRPQEAS